MSREEVLARKRENSRRLRSNPEYKKREAVYNSNYIKDPLIKQKKVRIQVKYERLKNFGLTPEQYEQMKIDQDHKCKICGTDDPKGRGDWHVDHCHTTGKVRGLLCFPCNTALGHFKDDPTILANAIQYLKETK